MLLHPSFFGLLQLSRKLDITVSRGQIIPLHAFRYFMHKTGLDRLLEEKLKAIGKDRNEEALAACSRQFRQIVTATKIPDELSAQLYECYFTLKDWKGCRSFRLQSVIEPLLGAPAYPIEEEYTAENIDGPATFLEAVHQAFAKVFTRRILESLIEYPGSAGSLALFMGLQVQPIFTEEVFGTCYRLLGPSCAHITRLSAVYGNPLVFSKGLSGADVFHVEETAGRLKIAFHEVHTKTKMWLTPGSRLLEPTITAVSREKQKTPCVGEDIIMQIVRAFKKVEHGMEAYRRFRIYPFLLWKVNAETDRSELLDLEIF